jgi:hypothetical protein
MPAPDPCNALAGFGNQPVIEFNNTKLNLGTRSPISSHRVKGSRGPRPPAGPDLKNPASRSSPTFRLKDLFDNDPHDGNVTLLEVVDTPTQSRHQIPQDPHRRR